MIGEQKVSKSELTCKVMNCFRYGYKAGTGTPCGFAMTIRGWQVSDYGCKCPSCCRGKSREGGLFALGSMYIYMYMIL